MQTPGEIGEGESSRVNTCGAIMAKYMLNLQAGHKPVKRSHLRARCFPELESEILKFDRVFDSANKLLRPLGLMINALPESNQRPTRKTVREPEYTLVSVLPRGVRRVVADLSTKNSLSHYGLLGFVLGSIVLSGTNGLSEEQLLPLLERAGLLTTTPEEVASTVKRFMNEKYIEVVDSGTPTYKLGPRTKLSVSYTQMLSILFSMLWPDKSMEVAQQEFPDELTSLKNLLLTSELKGSPP